MQASYTAYNNPTALTLTVQTFRKRRAGLSATAGLSCCVNDGSCPSTLGRCRIRGHEMETFDLSCTDMESRSAVHGDVLCRQVRSQYRHSISTSRHQLPRPWEHPPSDVTVFLRRAHDVKRWDIPINS